MTVQRWSLPGRTFGRNASSLLGQADPSDRCFVTINVPRLLIRTQIRPPGTREAGREGDISGLPEAQQQSSDSLAIQQALDDDDRQSPSYPNMPSLSASVETFETVSEGDGVVNPSESRLAETLPHIASLESVPAHTHTANDLEGPFELPVGELPCHDDQPSPTSSYPSECTRSPVPHQAPSPLLSTFSGTGGYTDIPADVGLFFDPLYAGQHAEGLPSDGPTTMVELEAVTTPPSIFSGTGACTDIPADVGLSFPPLYARQYDGRLPPNGPTLMDELAAVTTTTDSSTTHTVSTLELPSPQVVKGNTEIDTLCQQAVGHSISSKSSHRAEPCSEGRQSPSEVRHLCLLDDPYLLQTASEGQSFTNLSSQKIQSRDHSLGNAASVQGPKAATLLEAEAAVRYDLGGEENVLCTDKSPKYRRRGLDLSINQLPQLNESDQNSSSSEFCISDEIGQLPHLTRVKHHVLGSELHNGNGGGHTGFRTWVRYAYCQTKTFCQSQLGRQSSTKSARALDLFKPFRDFKRAQVPKTKKSYISRSLRFTAQTWRLRQATSSVDSSSDGMECSKYRRAVSCPK
ncbi:hypothetical protein Micbo1qcDRAFT_222045 [Microdochium bolleyi]|uniref:Uncharacterized protein n=1 Tax=Microdochium bolleyi TaxID=196109 RepID=A0A136IKN4_9PEZI|nr:hypothetical protein Micbo1qcDRAFT_222045 [Microdochium bolleyi]